MLRVFFPGEPGASPPRPEPLKEGVGSPPRPSTGISSWRGREGRRREMGKEGRREGDEGGRGEVKGEMDGGRRERGEQDKREEG